MPVALYINNQFWLRRFRPALIHSEMEIAATDNLGLKLRVMGNSVSGLNSLLQRGRGATTEL